jgi:hypothetical protein
MGANIDEVTQELDWMLVTAELEIFPGLVRSYFYATYCGIIH